MYIIYFISLCMKLKDMILPQLCGTVTVGTKGQVVLPKEVREKLGIKPKDQLLVFLKEGHAIGLIPAQDAKMLLEHLEEEMKMFHRRLS